MQISRSDCEKIAREKGLVVRERVTKDLDLLVVADPLTASTKAKNARSFGTRIIYEQAFFALLGNAEAGQAVARQPFCENPINELDGESRAYGLSGPGRKTRPANG